MLSAALNKLVKGDKDNVINIDLQSTSLDELTKELENVSLFAEKRIYAAYDCAFLLKQKGIRYLKNEVKQGSSFYEYLANPMEDVDLYLLASIDELPSTCLLMESLKKGGGKISPVKVFSYSEWLAFIPNYLNKRGYEIESGAIELFYERIQGDYGAFINEANKLMNYTFETKKISVEDVSNLVSAPLDENAFHLYEAIIKREPSVAFKVYQDLLKTSTSEVVLLHLIATQLRFLAMCLNLSSKGYDERMIASELKSSSYRVKMSLAKAYKLDLKKVEELIELTYQTDLSILRGEIEAQLAFKSYLAKAFLWKSS